MSNEVIAPGPPVWLELEVELSDAEVRVTARGSRGERPPPQSLGAAFTVERVEAFTRDVARAARRGKPLGEVVLDRGAGRRAA